MDSKTSPLALLAQTCSQIGADSNAIKSSTQDKKKTKSESSSKSPASTTKSPKTCVSPPENRSLSFKPYESNVLTRSDDRPSSKTSSVNSSVSDEKISTKINSNSQVPLRNNLNGSPEISVVNNSELKSDKQNDLDRKSSSPSENNQRETSPIIRSGLEILHGHTKDTAFKPGAFGLNTLGALGYMPGMEQHLSPAFRPPFGAGFSQSHSAMLAAAAGYTSSSSSNPCVSYARIKTPSGSETIVPICKDPYCAGCQYSQHNQYMMMGVPCPNGCTQCEQQKYGLTMQIPGMPTNNPYAHLSRPYVCSWTVGETYCGKRCATSDELLQHLRTHTPNLSDPAATAVLIQSQQQAMIHPALNPLFSMPSIHRTYSTPPLSPLSAARYLPYAKPSSTVPTTLAASPYGPFNPYYSPYAIYNQRLGAAVAPQ